MIMQEQPQAAIFRLQDQKIAAFGSSYT